MLMKTHGVFVSFLKAHDRKSNLRDHLRPTHRRHSRLHRFFYHLHSLAKCLHSGVHYCVDDRVHNEVSTEERKKQDSDRDYLSIKWKVYANARQFMKMSRFY